VYSYLYDSMIAWYAAQKYSAGRHVHWYAVTTLTSMESLNLVSVIAVSAHWKAEWALRLLATMRDPLLFALL
jgi:hypothetical protein